MTITDRLAGINEGVAVKAPCVVATTANITLAGTQTIDGVAVVAGDRVLVKDQTTGTENGIYNVSAGAWERAKDFNGTRDVVTGTQVYVISGTTNAQRTFFLSTANPVIGSSSLTWDFAANTAFVFANEATTTETTTGTSSTKLMTPRRTKLSIQSGLWFTQTGTGATARTLPAKAKDIVSVKDFGATGDGVTNDTTYIQNAINTGATLVFFPAGTYMIDATGLTGYSDQTWRGDGFATTLKLSTNPTGDFISFGSRSRVVLENLTIDWNNKTAAGNYASISMASGTDLHIRSCRIINIDKFGIALNACTRFWITDNYIHKQTAANTQNQAILVSAAAGASSYGFIKGNYCSGSGMDLDCFSTRITENTVDTFKFGGGITTEQSATCYGLIIANNHITGGTGTDVNSTVCPGIENWAAWSAITGNTIYLNAGTGIDQGGNRCVVTDNIVFNNGQTTNSAAIATRYGTSTYNGSESVIANNRCFDTNGAGGTQTYGYIDQGSSTSYVVVSSNSFKGNKTGAMNPASTVFSFDGQTLEGSASWNPGTITNAGNATATMTVAGAVVGDPVTVGFSQDIQGVKFFGYVSSANTVSMRFENNTGGSITISSGTAYARVHKMRFSADF